MSTLKKGLSRHKTPFKRAVGSQENFYYFFRDDGYVKAFLLAIVCAFAALQLRALSFHGAYTTRLRRSGIAKNVAQAPHTTK